MTVLRDVNDIHAIRKSYMNPKPQKLSERLKAQLNTYDNRHVVAIDMDDIREIQVLELALEMVAKYEMYERRDTAKWIESAGQEIEREAEKK